MRKTIMLGTFIALLSAGAVAHARDVTTTEPGAATEATQPAVRDQDDAREGHHEYRYRHGRHHEYRSRYRHHEARHGDREHHDEAHERHHEGREHGWRR
jgi:hypothetical protein